jgi:Spy/CpxP family protein refolding chaperone
MPPGRWWDDPNIAQTIGLSPAQIKKMDDTFNGSRDHLIDLDAAVRKAEGGLQPLLESDPIDRAKILAQIDRLTQAKAELEKTSAQMLLDILRIAPAPSAGALSFTNTDTTNRP